MQLSEASSILKHFHIDSAPVEINPHGNGLINSTLAIITESGKKYILQKINTYVFKEPEPLMKNIVGVTKFLKKKISAQGGDTLRETLSLVQSDNGKYFYHDEKDDAYWRVYIYIDNATAYQSAEKSGILYEAARAFGHFQKQLSDYDASTLSDTIPNFHNTAARYDAFEQAVAEDAAGRAASVAEEIALLRQYKPYSSLIVDAIREGKIPLRVTHNDTKLNNVMFDDVTDKAICVIDLDTVMSGSLLYDFGDSVRFAANNGDEDDRDLSRVWLRLELYEEYVSGFLSGLEGAATPAETDMLGESVLVLTYELALRFMTDYLNGDKYFKILSEDHNIVRTRAQIQLMKDIASKLGQMKEITQKYV